MLQLLLAVFIGGGTGSVARWMLSMRFNPMHQAIPIGTLTANLLGAFIIGVGLAWFSRMTNIDPVWKVLITTGFWSSGLGNAECVSQPVGIICDDGVSILAIFRLQRALKTKKNPLISGF